MKIFINLCAICIIVLLFDCNNTGNLYFNVSDYIPITNFQNKNHSIDLDYTDAIDSGFTIPSKRQTNNGYFDYEFSISNNGKTSQSFYYKIYYQNESYKFSEENEFADENFYGSWENTDIGFVKTKVVPNDGKKYKIKGSIRIVGNPRNEKKYFGCASRYYLTKEPTKEDISKIIKNITDNPEWLKSVKEKADKNKITLEKQLEKDAYFIFEENKTKGDYNNRWKRNPRVGNYSFLLVVTNEYNIINNVIPPYVQYISLMQNNKYVNPYSYYLDNSEMTDLYVTKIDNSIKVKAHPDLGKGIYINPNAFKYIQMDTSGFSSNCNNRFAMYKQAAVDQFVHSLRDDVLLNNIPATADVTTDKYSIKDYAENVQKYYNKRVVKPVQITECPCQTVKSDSIAHSITIKNPASKPDEFKKQDVGIITRHGFVYGKFKAKVKLTSLLNEQQVWNGITNAIWLIYESTEEWNKRRICNKEGGYQPTYYSGKGDARIPAVCYSEIDFEVLKASHRWPATSYKDVSKRPKDDPSMKDKIMVTCTNWDMACWEPKNFDVGVHQIDYENQTFSLHRWDHWYNAVTLKNPQSEKEIFDSDYYCFEIEWKPTEIIWRIGPSEDKMRIVGYMNNTVTSIPNNQMLLIVTQEFHITRWWPEAPFAQDNIPFPAKDITGYIYDIEIE